MSFARYFNPRLRPLILSGEEPEWLKIHPRRSYIVACVVATPPWGDELLAALKRIHDQVKCISAITGEDHVADHIIPLNHPYVCGLNVPANLQVTTRAMNARKSNRWHPDQMELF